MLNPPPPPTRLRGRGLPHPLPAGLQAQRLVALVALQHLLRQRAEGQVEVAAREALQRRAALPQAGPEESGEVCSAVPARLFNEGRAIKCHTERRLKCHVNDLFI